ncbi:alpha,alpha-trehalase TreA [Pseudoxanthomonas sp.]|uniref:alpha,alpha-trehalase TreA n=1 Tax=Pseudoxanthomonas sp. TaxID=1871049 RepID=UPI0025829DD1|nr:alpha,alpha-trehalase TreA [Pseudoxanthomonas sp.]MCR6686706.1 alpha,alpha-trehalase TreA [Pseudoxanthomonas sp.]
MYSLRPRLAWLLCGLLSLGACTTARAPMPPAGAAQLQAPAVARPVALDEACPGLFAAVQRAQLFEDQKFFADAVPRRAPAAIEADYLARRATPGFDLRRFVQGEFVLPAAPAQAQVGTQASLRAHMDALWPLLTRSDPQPAAHDSLLPLPQPYVVPGGRFRELYYWDSWFTMLGLVESGQDALSRQMLEDFAHLIDAWGHVPNGSRSYYLSRSQPPFFSHMVELESRRDPDLAVRYLPQLRREHAFWMDGADGLAPGGAHRRVVRLTDGSLLNRYWDDRDAPRPESFLQDERTAAASARPPREVYRELRAGAESGWDYSSRWLAEPMRLETIRTSELLPVDLNSLLHHLEATIAATCDRAGDAACARDYRARARARAAAIERHLWHPQGYYADYDLRRGAPSPALTAAALFPLHAGIASPARAGRTAESARARLLRPGGLVTTGIDSGQQWDAPNVWAPLQWIAVDGLRRYGQDALAADIARAFVGNVQALFARDRKLVEKYDADGALQGGGGGEYPLQDGFGWTNGVVLKLLATYPELERHAPGAAASVPAAADADTPGSNLAPLARRPHSPIPVPTP